MISLIIPTLNAEKYLLKLFESIYSQTIVPDEIIVLDSESTDNTLEICQKTDKVRIINIKRTEFDHAGTRHIGFVEAKGDICFVMSQDALPCDEFYFEKMLDVLQKNDDVVMVTARQVPYDDCPVTERITRKFNYPESDSVKDKSMLKELGVKAYFFSDVCSAYKKDAYFKLGGYDVPALICNDMIMAAKAINAGYKTCYVSEAKIYHSHKYTLKQQYKRNFDVAADMTINSHYFSGVSDTKEGIKMVKYVLKELLCHFHFITAVYYCVECCAKLLGNRAGKRYKKLSKKQILKKTNNKNYWLKSGMFD